MRNLILCVAVLMCGTAGLAAFAIHDQPKQEKAQPTYIQSITSATTTMPRCKDAKFGELCMTKDGLFRENLPFDLPAKEWDDTIQVCCPPEIKSCEVYPEGGCPDWAKGPVKEHRVSCNKDVAPDWKQRVLLDSADGKHHCYALYLLEQKP